MRTGYLIEDGFFYFICDSESHELVERVVDEGYEVSEFYHLLDGSYRIAVRLPCFGKKQAMKKLIEIVREVNSEH